jgi:hypothetical protein
MIAPLKVYNLSMEENDIVFWEASAENHKSRVTDGLWLDQEPACFLCGELMPLDSDEPLPDVYICDACIEFLSAS